MAEADIAAKESSSKALHTHDLSYEQQLALVESMMTCYDTPLTQAAGYVRDLLRTIIKLQPTGIAVKSKDTLIESIAEIIEPAFFGDAAKGWEADLPPQRQAEARAKATGILALVQQREIPVIDRDKFAEIFHKTAGERGLGSPSPLWHALQPYLATKRESGLRDPVYKALWALRNAMQVEIHSRLTPTLLLFQNDDYLAFQSARLGWEREALEFLKSCLDQADAALNSIEGGQS